MCISHESFDYQVCSPPVSPIKALLSFSSLAGSSLAWFVIVGLGGLSQAGCGDEVVF